MTSPMQGTVVKVTVAPGAQVMVGDPICIVEAMKMENRVAAPVSGTVRAVSVGPGDTVPAGAVLVVIEPDVA